MKDPLQWKEYLQRPRLLFDRFLPCKGKNNSFRVKQQLSRAGNFNISGNFFPITFEFSARPK